MTATTKTPLGASTLNRKWFLDVDSGPLSAAAVASTDVLTLNGHGMPDGTPVEILSGPGPFTPGDTYFVRDAAANTFKLAATEDGAAVDVAADGPVSFSRWIGVFGITEFQPALAQTMQDSSDFDSDGYGADEITQQKWSVVGKVKRKARADAPDEYDPGQEILRLAGQEIGRANRVHVRFYEMNGAGGPEVEAYRGYASVSWNPDGGDQTALSTVAFTLNGQGKRIAIPHPNAT